MKYDDPECAYCPPTVRACRQGEAAERGPGFCPSQVDPECIQAHARAAFYDDPETRPGSRKLSSAACSSPRATASGRASRRSCKFAKRMGFRKIGIANCISFVDHAYVLSGILESHGFEVVSVACKNGNIPKEELGVADHEKIRPGQFEPLCNPVSQAELLNAPAANSTWCSACASAMTACSSSTRGADHGAGRKGRVLAHNPIGALDVADTYTAGCGGPIGRRSRRSFPSRVVARAARREPD